MTMIADELRARLLGTSAPFLFVGAGFARRYADADGWEDLLRRFANMTPLSYDYYRASGDGNFPRIASKIAESFHELWWTSERFSASRERWASNIQGTESALKVEVANYCQSLAGRIATKGALSEELAALKGAVIDGIVTTNYDQVIENLFPDYHVYIGQDSLLLSESHGIGEIYKIHGCCSSPDTIVLTENDYEQFDNRQVYLSAKLMTVFSEHPIILIGYSLSDPNVTKVLANIVSCLTQNNISKLQDHLLFVRRTQDGEPESIVPQTIVINSIVLPIIQINVQSLTGVFEVLSTLTRAFPAKLLRRLKSRVYELVLSDNPHPRMAVVDIESAETDSDIDVVFGVGTIERLGTLGYRGLDRWNLMSDVINHEGKLNPELVLTVTLADTLVGNTHVPIFKYLRESGAMSDSGELTREVSSKVSSRFASWHNGAPTNATVRARAASSLSGTGAIAAAEQSLGASFVMTNAPGLTRDIAVVDELKTFLTDHKDRQDSFYAKLVCHYDWLVYGPR